MVAGKAVNREQIAAFIAASEGVVAFNAAFDRPFVAMRCCRICRPCRGAAPWPT
jgi:DNA polymerase III epsilon subunit-like protein